MYGSLWSLKVRSNTNKGSFNVYLCRFHPNSILWFHTYWSLSIVIYSLITVCGPLISLYQHKRTTDVSHDFALQRRCIGFMQFDTDLAGSSASRGVSIDDSMHQLTSESSEDQTIHDPCVTLLIQPAIAYGKARWGSTSTPPSSVGCQHIS